VIFHRSYTVDDGGEMVLWNGQDETEARGWARAAELAKRLGRELDLSTPLPAEIALSDQEAGVLLQARQIAAAWRKAMLHHFACDPDAFADLVDGVDWVDGVWTPWAEALCRNCYDSIDHPLKREIIWLGRREATDRFGVCTRCGAPIWVREDVAVLTRLRALVGGDLEQRGGMCVALSIKREDGGRVAVTGDATLVISVFEPGIAAEGQPSKFFTLPTGTPDATAAVIIKLALSEPLVGPEWHNRFMNRPPKLDRFE
jgi:hypothetical protein